MPDIGRKRQAWRVAILIDELSWSQKTRVLLAPLEDYRQHLMATRLELQIIRPQVEALCLWAETGEHMLGRHLQRALVELMRQHFELEHHCHIAFGKTDSTCRICQSGLVGSA